MSSKNKYFKYKGNYYTSKEYIDLINREPISQSGGEKKNKNESDCLDSSRMEGCYKNPIEKITAELIDELKTFYSMSMYIWYYLKNIVSYASNQYRVYYIPLTYRYNLTFKSVPWLFTLRSPLFYRSVFTEIEPLNMINIFAYDKEVIRDEKQGRYAKYYHKAFKNLQETSNKYIWNEVFEKLFIPLAVDIPADSSGDMPSGIGGAAPDAASNKSSTNPASDESKGKGSGSIEKNDELILDIVNVKDTDSKKYKRLTRESFNFLLLILQNITLINENEEIDKIKDIYKNQPLNEDNTNKYKSIIKISNFLKTGVLDVTEDGSFKIWNKMRIQLKNLIKASASKYKDIKFYIEKEAKDIDLDTDKEKISKPLHDIITLNGGWKEDSYIKSIFKMIYNIGDTDSFDFDDIKLDLSEIGDSNSDIDIAFSFIRLNILSLNILSLSIDDLDDEELMKEKLIIIDKIFIVCYVLNIRNIPIGSIANPYKKHKSNLGDFESNYIPEYNKEYSNDKKITTIGDMKDSKLKLEIYRDKKIQ